MGADASMKDNTTAPLAMGVDQLRDIAIDLRELQLLDHKVAFPRPISVLPPVLDGAAAANAEVRANRFDPIGAWHVDTHEMAPVRMSCDIFDLDALTR